MSSPLPASLPAQQQVLETDKDLLRAVLSFLGADVAECHAALLVNKLWGAALEMCVWWVDEVEWRSSPHSHLHG